ncbi:MAG TPA: patatin-like phospholipase family protein [Gemmatimonadaceae bacterium]|nr:patatin-like phospholipase family protein [Gemmatimonadaceae bacterium]
MAATPIEERPYRIALVLGGGGLKGFAHIGVLQALEDAGLRLAVLGGTSIGALIAAAYASGMSTLQMAERARAFRRRDLFRLNHVGMLLERMQSPSIYLATGLRETVESIVPHRRFSEMKTPLMVCTVDVERATQVVWGLPGMPDAYVDDAVYASCALPGFFPPGEVAGRRCIDGGTIDNLPVAFTPALGADVVIAVDVGNGELPPGADITERGFASIYMRAATIMMNALQLEQLGARESGPPVLLVRPRISHISWFAFGRAEELMQAGYSATREALADLARAAAAPAGIFPRRLVRVNVLRERCVGCGTCVALAPRVMRMGGDGIAEPAGPQFVWSPADGGFVRHCPTNAIVADVAGGNGEFPARATEPIAVHTEPVGTHAQSRPLTEGARRGPRIRRRTEGGR